MDKTDDFLTRPSRNQKGYVAVWMNSPEIPPTPLVKGGRGGISELSCQFGQKIIPSSKETPSQAGGF
jgi:hypothetical protein